MADGRGRNRKRPRKEPRDRNALSSVLREIGTAIQRRRFEAGLKQLNDELTRRRDVPTQARLLALAGDSEFKRGAFERAATIYLRAAQMVVNHPVLWSRGLLGCVRALLKVPQIEKAVVMAEHVLELAKQKNAEFRNLVLRADQELLARGYVRIPLAPPRVSVIATRLGKMFLNEGEMALAERFFQSALQENPDGACCARIALARMALIRGEAEKAVEESEAALRLGKFQAKTLAAWSVLIAARRQAGGWQIKDSLLRGLDQGVAPKVRDRATLLIVQELKRRDMRQWQQVAEKWLNDPRATDRVVEVELRKLLLAGGKAEKRDPSERQQQAESLLRVPGLDRMEWLAGVKAWVAAVLEQGKQPDMGRWLDRTEQRYGVEWRMRAAHGLALVCMNARRHDLARTLLNSVISRSSQDTDIWGKAVWALARMESVLGNYSASADMYRLYAEKSRGPDRFRLQARLLWACALASSGKRDALLAVKPEIENILSRVSNPCVLMDFARQMLAADASLEDWAYHLFEQGCQMALASFRAAEHPSVAMDILFKLTRRQVCDFRRFEEAILFWESLSEQTKTWLWSEKESFWEYLGWIFEAYTEADRREEAEAFAAQWLEDRATSAFGHVHIGVRWGRWLLKQAKVKQALDLFERAVTEAPFHPFCGLAWYWKALKFHKEGNISERDRCLANLRTAQGDNPGLWYAWSLDAKALLLKSDLDVRKAESRTGRYGRDDLRRLREEILREASWLP